MRTKGKGIGHELSEYVVRLAARWKEHATETADALNRINPDFIRFRTLKVLRDMPLYGKVESGDFVILHEEEILIEEKYLIDSLKASTAL